MKPIKTPIKQSLFDIDLLVRSKFIDTVEKRIKQVLKLQACDKETYKKKLKK